VQQTLPPPQLPFEALSPRPLPLSVPRSLNTQALVQLPPLAGPLQLSPSELGAEGSLLADSVSSEPSVYQMPSMGPVVPIAMNEPDPPMPTMRPVVPLSSATETAETADNGTAVATAATATAAAVAETAGDGSASTDFSPEGATSTQFTNFGNDYGNNRFITVTYF